jgi:hypothetical protein
MTELENCSDLDIKVVVLNECAKKRKIEGDDKNNVDLVLETEQLKSISLDQVEKMLSDDLKKSELNEEAENGLIEDNCEMDDNDILPKFDSLDPAWQNFVGKVKVDVCAKKRQYLGLLRKKKAALTAVDKIEEIKKDRQKSIYLVTGKILSNKGLIADSKEIIEKLQEEIKIKSKQNAQMQAYVKQEALKVEKNSRSIHDVGSTFNAIEDEVASVLEMNESKSEPIERDDAEVNKLENDNLKGVLGRLVSAHKKQLTCPGCQEMSSPPIYKCPAEHLICSSCYTGKVKTRCPKCRLQLDLTGQGLRFKSAEVAWEELKTIEDKVNQ